MKNKVTAQDFFETCEKYAQKLGAIDTDRLVSKKAWGVSLSFKICRAEIVYFYKGAFPASRNTMCCRVFVNKNSPIFFMLSDIQAELGENDFRAVYFSKINSQSLGICVDSMTQVLGDYVRKIEESLLTCFDDSLYENLFDEYRRDYKLKPEDLDFSLIGNEEEYDHFYFLNMQYERERSLVFKFTQLEPYIYLIMGSPEVALFKYEKMKETPSKYERKLIEFLKTPAAEGFSIFRPEYEQMAKTVVKKSNYIVQAETDRKLPLFWLLVTGIFAIIFCLIMIIIQTILSQGTIDAYFTPWYWGTVPAFLCGIFGGIALRKPLTKLFEGKKADVKILQDEMVNSKGINVVAYAFFGLMVLIAFFITLVFSIEGARVYENKFDVLGWIGFSKEEYYYEDIEKVYHIDARYNDYGDRIERGSYIVYMKDGSFYDFDCTASEKQTEKSLLPLIEKEGIEIVPLDSDRDLPFELFEE